MVKFRKLISYIFANLFLLTAQAMILHHISRIDAGRILDVGCGKGGIIKFFLSNGWRFRGILIGFDIYTFFKKAKASKIYDDALLANNINPVSLLKNSEFFAIKCMALEN
jgi:SAM-dependent methyltransferase